MLEKLILNLENGITCTLAIHTHTVVPPETVNSTQFILQYILSGSDQINGRHKVGGAQQQLNGRLCLLHCRYQLHRMDMHVYCIYSQWSGDFTYIKVLTEWSNYMQLKCSVASVHHRLYIHVNGLATPRTLYT